MGRGDGHGEGAVSGERPWRFRGESVTSVPQLEDGQLRLWGVRVHDPVRGTPNFSYAAFFLFRSIRAVLGDRISITSSGGSVNFAPPTWSMLTTTRPGSNSVYGPSSTAGSGTTHRSSGQALLRML